ncbi:MAG: apolipoprotein N-acyltransferase [Desulfamplus sp.]|nr:apolipoprotein N-acyltransferase [Desulfamplus sp.]
MNSFIIIITQYFPSMLSGFLLTLAFPKTEFHWLAWLALVPMILSLYKLNNNKPNDKKILNNQINFIIRKNSNAKQAFYIGFIMGLCHFLSLIYWIVPTISTYGQLPLSLALPILLLLAYYLALYPALFTWGINWFGGNTKFMPLIAACLWVSLEYIRSIFLTGFPWGLVGYSQYMNLNLIQIADITSVYGVSFIVVLTNGVVAKLLIAILSKKELRKNFKIDQLQGKQLKLDAVVWIISPTVWLISLIVIFGGVIGYGKFRIADIEKESAKSEKVNLSVIQGNIEQVFKWDLAYQESTILKYCELSTLAVQEFRQKAQQKTDLPQKTYKELEQFKDVEQLKPDLIIFPETALPFYYVWNQKLSDKVDECIKNIGTTFLVGSPAFQIVDEVQKTYKFYNRAYMVNKLGIITGSYDKVHLVPFGEYVPFGKYLSFLGKIIAQAGDFSSGKLETNPLAFNGSSAGVLICFEVIFPYLARASVQNGANILVTMTNDAWFGYTSAAKQHFTMAVFRAVENRRLVARAANTGISGFIDPTGKIIQASNLFEDITLTQSTPSMEIKTIYSKFGDIFAFLCLFAIGAGFVINISKKIKQREYNQEL